MRKLVNAVITAAILAVFIISATARADEMKGTRGEGVEPSAGESEAAEGQETVTCPECGGNITVGRHGQEAQVMTCPYCGKEIRPEGKEGKALIYGTDIGFFGKYVSRGVTTTDGPVFEPNLWLSYSGFTANLWGNMDLTDKNGRRGDMNELDFTLDYSGEAGRWEYSMGGIYYTYPHTAIKDTAEVYAGISYDAVIEPKLAVYYDFWQGDGFYTTFALEHEFELPELVKGYKALLELYSQVGLGTKNFNELNFGVSHTAFTDLVFTASLPIALSDHFSFKPSVCYSTVLDRTLRANNAHNDNVIWGAVVSASL
jgi:ribosomal protein S27E